MPRADIKLERLVASALGDDAIHVQGFDIGPSAIVFLFVSVVQAIACRGNGFFIQNTTVAEFHDCYANGNAIFGAYCYSCQAAWYSSAFENNCLLSTPDNVIAGDVTSLLYGADTGAQLRMRYSVPGRVESCDFEQFGDTIAGQPRLAKKAIVFEASTGGLVSNTSFFNGGGATSVTGTGIYVTSDSNQGGWVTILTNNFINVQTPVELELGVRAVTVMPQRISATLPGTPAMSGVLGIAIPARPFSEVPNAPISEAAGQLVFDTTSGRLKCWDGSFWRTLSW